MISRKLPALDITLVMGCKLNCDYCPQDKLIRRYYENTKKRKKKLSFEDFKIVLEKVEEGATIGFAGLSEPFMNEECSDMIVYAYERGYKISLYTTLVGMKMEDIEKLKGIKFDRLVLHIPDEEYRSKFNIDKEYLRILEEFHKNFSINFYSCHGKVHPEVKSIIDLKKYRDFKPQNRAGNLEKEEFDKINWKGKIACYRAWSSEAWSVTFTPEMLPDGTLLFCCQDYGLKHQIGNLVEQAWEEIQNGKEFQKVVAGFKDDTIDTLCRTCSCAKRLEDVPPIRFQRAIQKRKEKISTADKESLIESPLIDRFAYADTVCIFGLGKLFREHFFQEHWAEGLGVSIFSDNKESLWGTVLHGKECVCPGKLAEYSDILVVLFVKSGCNEIIRQLNNMGIHNIITIDEVLDTCNSLLGKEEI